METSRRSLSVFLFFAMIMISLRCNGDDGTGAAQLETNSAKSPTASVKNHQVASELREQRNKDNNNAEVRNGNRKIGGGGGGGGGCGGGWRWGNGGGGGGGAGGSSSSGSMGGGGGWGWGAGGGGWWGWGCMRPRGNQNGRGHGHKKRSFSTEDYRIGEYAECMGGGRCQGMRLDCPLHCGGPCLYDCKNMCKAHCRR